MRGIKKKKLVRQRQLLVVAVFVLLVTFTAGSLYLLFRGSIVEKIAVSLDPNIGIEMRVKEFFIANGAPEMIDIIACESEFKHYEDDGSVLKNREGSSAIGVAQILTSKHPDPRAVEKYNRLHNTELTVDDFDITTLDGNLGYALLLYEIRGIKDWECRKHLSFHN